MKVGKKIIIGSFVFLICGILVLSRQHHKSSALFLYYILTFDSSQQLQQMRRPSVSVEREAGDAVLILVQSRKKVRKEKRKNDVPNVL